MGNIKSYLIILDLDSTLITHSIFPKVMMPDVVINNPAEIGVLPYPGKLYIYKRPYLDQFLQFCFQHFYVGLWTAAEPSWMNLMLDTVLAPYADKFLFTWNRNQTDIRFGWFPMFTKPLTKVWARFPQFNQANTLIIDDYQNVTDNECCQLTIKPFTPRDLDDFELLKVSCVLRVLLQRDGKIETNKAIAAYNLVKDSTFTH